MKIKKYSNLHRRTFDKSIFYSWEMILVYLLIFINILLMACVPDIYFAEGSLQTIIRSGMDLSIMVLGMTFILVLGEIDVSVASIMILSAMIMGLSYGAGVPAILAIILGILAGALCGFINGFFVSVLRLPSVIVTIATSMLFRGVVRAVLKDNFLNTFPSFFADISWYDIGGVVPVSMLIFIAFAIIFGIILHKSTFGRKLFIIGNSKEVANYSGIRVNQTRIIAFVIMGATAALSSIFFVGRLGGITFSMGSGYDLKVIAIVVLGGVSTLGGKGKLIGPVISTFFMAFLAKSLDLFEVHPNVQKIAIGVVLILAVLIPRLNKETFLKIKLRIKSKEIKRLEAQDVSLNIEKAKQKVVAKESKRMSKEEFFKFLNELQITTSSLDYNVLNNRFNETKKILLEAKLKKEKGQVLEGKKEQYNIAKNNLSFYFEVMDELLKTKIDLIQLNYFMIEKEVRDNAGIFYDNFEKSKDRFLTLDKEIENLKLTQWKIEENTKANTFISLYKERFVTFFKANKLFAKIGKKNFKVFYDKSNNLFVDYLLLKYQNKINNCVKKEKIFLMKSIRKLEKEELKQNEKK